MAEERQFAWHIHHDALIELIDRDGLDTRATFVVRSKAPYELKTRLFLMRPAEVQPPDYTAEIAEIVRAANTLYADYDRTYTWKEPNGQKALQKREVLNQQVEELEVKRAELREASELRFFRNPVPDYVLQLHKEQCEPDCTWGPYLPDGPPQGSSIFPENFMESALYKRVQAMDWSEILDKPYYATTRKFMLEALESREKYYREYAIR